MAGVRDWFRNAFTVESADDAEPTPAQREIADKVCREVVRRRMATPAIMFLEMSRPMNYVGAQAMVFFQPIVAVVIDPTKYDEFSAFLEERSSIDYLVRTIERFEAQQNEGNQSTEP